MFELSSVATVAAAPQAVWRVLMDFAGYRAWTKAVMVDGEPTLGGPLNYRITGRFRSGTRRAIRFEGTIKLWTANREMVWTSGIPGILGLRFGFELHPSGAATEFRHYLEVSGIAAPLARRRLDRLYGPILAAVTKDLAHHFSKTRLATLRVAPDIRRRRPKPKRGGPHG